jgi:hypothetical protein
MLRKWSIMVLLGKGSFEKALDGVFSRKVVLRYPPGYLKKLCLLSVYEIGEVTSARTRM